MLKKIRDCVFDKLLSVACAIFIVFWTVGVTIFVFPFYCFKNREKIKSMHHQEQDDDRK